MKTSPMLLLRAVTRDGFEVHADEVRSLLSTARGRGIAPLLCDVVGDDSVADPVRTRALSLIVRDLTD